MKNQVKKFSQFVNESKFYHALPQGETRLRDQYRELAAGEQSEIQEMAKELDELNILSEFKKGLSKYKTIAEIKKAMQQAIESNTPVKNPPSHDENGWPTSGWSIRRK